MGTTYIEETVMYSMDRELVMFLWSEYEDEMYYDELMAAENDNLSMQWENQND